MGGGVGVCGELGMVLLPPYDSVGLQLQGALWLCRSMQGALWLCAAHSCCCQHWSLLCIAFMFTIVSGSSC